ncbi:MAG: PIG-L deacetylase family protein [Thermoguttaceae bacterium]
MNFDIVFERRTENGLIRSANPGEVWPDWKGADERWLFVAPHDDDIVCGAGMTFIAAVENGIDVYAVVTTTGEAGYCRPEHRGKIAAIRQQETRESFKLLGLPDGHLTQFKFPDAYLGPYLGHRQCDDPNDPTAIEGATGYQNSYVWILRKIRPTRVFLPSCTDIHPDHQAVHNEFVMSVFHAQGNIWPELGPELTLIPALYEYGTYSDFLDPPTIRIRGNEHLLEKKLAGIKAYVSQEQIETLVDIQRKVGPVEYIREMRFSFFNPNKYDALFK